MKKMLIVYYSWSNGNTKKIAEEAAKKTGADLVAIETRKPYTGTYEEVVSQGQREVEAGYEPPLKPLGVSLSDYDIIAVGTPTWWYTMAPAVKTFFSENDLSGKTVVPFMTNGGWPGHVIRDMTAAAKDADVVCPMEIRFDSTGGSRQVTDQKEVDQWLDSLVSLL